MIYKGDTAPNGRFYSIDIPKGHSGLLNITGNMGGVVTVFERDFIRKSDTVYTVRKGYRTNSSNTAENNDFAIPVLIYGGKFK